MKIRDVKLIGIVILLLLVLCSGALAQTIRIGTASAKQGQTVSVPVTLTATTSHTAALVRIQYNTAALESPSAAPGPMLPANHVLDSHAPAGGRFDVALYATAAMPSFKSRSGTLFSLTFRVKTTAPSGVSPITFTAVGTPSLPSADLVGITGAAVTPTAIVGSVNVVAAAVDDSWRLYQ